MSNPAFKFDHVHITAKNPRETAEWYVDMFGAEVMADTMARGAPQIFLELGGVTILVRGQRPGEAPVDTRPNQAFCDFASHNEWGTDHFGFLYKGDLEAFCAELRAKGVKFPVALKTGVGGKRLCFVTAPDNVSIEIMEC